MRLSFNSKSTLKQVLKEKRGRNDQILCAVKKFFFPTLFTFKNWKSVQQGNKLRGLFRSATSSPKLYAYQNLPLLNLLNCLLFGRKSWLQPESKSASLSGKNISKLRRKKLWTRAEVSLLQPHKVSVLPLLEPLQRWAPLMPVTQGADKQWAHLKTKKWLWGDV